MFTPETNGGEHDRQGHPPRWDDAAQEREQDQGPDATVWPTRPDDPAPGDARPSDAGSSDAGSSEVPSSDAWSPDAGSSDAWSSDGGSSDARSSGARASDAGFSDTRPSDAGFSDTRPSDARPSGRSGLADIAEPPPGGATDALRAPTGAFRQANWSAAFGANQPWELDGSDREPTPFEIADRVRRADADRALAAGGGEPHTAGTTSDFPGAGPGSDRSGAPEPAVTGPASAPADRGAESDSAGHDSEATPDPVRGSTAPGGAVDGDATPGSAVDGGAIPGSTVPDASFPEGTPGFARDGEPAARGFEKAATPLSGTPVLPLADAPAAPFSGGPTGTDHGHQPQDRPGSPDGRTEHDTSPHGAGDRDSADEPGRSITLDFAPHPTPAAGAPSEAAAPSATGLHPRSGPTGLRDEFEADSRAASQQATETPSTPAIPPPPAPGPPPPIPSASGGPTSNTPVAGSPTPVPGAPASGTPSPSGTGNEIAQTTASTPAADRSEQVTPTSGGPSLGTSAPAHPSGGPNAGTSTSGHPSVVPNAGTSAPGHSERTTGESASDSTSFADHPGWNAPTSGAPSYPAPTSGAPASSESGYAAPTSGAPAFDASGSGASGYDAPVSGMPSQVSPTSGAPVSGAPDSWASVSGEPVPGVPDAGGSGRAGTLRDERGGADSGPTAAHPIVAAPHGGPDSPASDAAPDGEAGRAAAAFPVEMKRPAPPKIEPEFRVIPPEPMPDDSPTIPTPMVSPLTGQPITGLSLGERLIAAGALESVGYFAPQPASDEDVRSGRPDEPGHTDLPSDQRQTEHAGQGRDEQSDRGDADRAGSWDIPDTSARESYLRLVPPVPDDGWTASRDDSRQEPAPANRAEPDRPDAGRTPEPVSPAAAYPARVFPRIFEPLEPPAEMPGLFESRKPATPAPSLFEPVQHRLSEPPAEQHDVRSAAERLSAPPAPTSPATPEHTSPVTPEQTGSVWPATGPQQPDPAPPQPADQWSSPTAPRTEAQWPSPASPQPADQWPSPAPSRSEDRQQSGAAASWSGETRNDPGTPWSGAAHEPGERWRDDSFGSGPAADQARPATGIDPAQERPALPRFAVSRPENSTPVVPARFPSGAPSDSGPAGAPRSTDGPAAHGTGSPQGLLPPRYATGVSAQPYATSTGPQQESGPAPDSVSQRDTAAFPLPVRPAAERAGGDVQQGNVRPFTPPATGGSASPFATGPVDTPTAENAVTTPSVSGARPETPAPAGTPWQQRDTASGPAPADAPWHQQSSTEPSLASGTTAADAPWQSQSSTEPSLGSGTTAAGAPWQQRAETAASFPDGPASEPSWQRRDPGGSPFGSVPADDRASRPEPPASEPAASGASSWPSTGTAQFGADAPWLRQDDTAAADAPWQQRDPFAPGSAWGADTTRSGTDAPGSGAVHEGVLLPPEESRPSQGSRSAADSWGADDAWSATDDWTPQSPRAATRPARDDAGPAPVVDDDGWSVGAVQPARKPAAAQGPGGAAGAEQPEEEQKPEKRRRGLFRRRNQPPQGTPVEPVPLRDEEYVDWVSGLGDRSADD